MDLTFTGNYKSLTDFKWSEIPKLVVITGPNGSGKTQLLELIHEAITTLKEHNWRLDFGDEVYDHNEVIYLKGDWGVVNVPKVDVGTVQGAHKSKYSSAFANFDKPGSPTNSGYRESENQKREYDNLRKSLNKSHRFLVTYEEFSEAYPKNYLELNAPINRQISNVLFNYRIAQIDAAADGLNSSDIVKKLGPPPWSVLREIIKVSRLPFDINDPSRLSIWDSYEFKLKHTITDKEINFVDLSSGEKILISIIFYLYQSQENNIFPKLLLMDEPDAHLHPSMAQQFLSVVKDVLVDKFNIQVLLTTHSPSTVVLTPESSLFEMSIHEPRIRLSPSKNHSVGLLTAGLVYVGDGTKYFLVEDKADVEFYSHVNNQLVVEQVLNPDIPLVFIKASTSENSGGKTVVASWVNKLVNSGLNGIIQGLIDKDDQNTSSEGIFTIDRYSIENYLVDPLVIYACLLDIGQINSIDGINLSMGEEYKLKTLSEDKLQCLVNNICSKIQPELTLALGAINDKPIIVQFTNGITLEYPLWLINSRGKTILNEVCNRVFTSKVNFTSLFKAFKRLNLIPKDLAEKFIELQKVQ